jgi:4-amino-4-deoxy-L-arabinose transferase-like glycosyltransferase
MTSKAPSLLGENLAGRSVFLILCIALLINVGILFEALPVFSGFLSPRYSIHFQDLYDLIASNLVSGNGYRIEPDMGRTMMREPGYPLFLAMVFKIAGYHIEAARFANLLLAFGSGLVVMRLARKIADDKTTAVLAALLFLSYPGTLIAEARGGVEIAFVFGVVLFMLFLYQAIEKGSLWHYFVAGMFIGAATLVRSEVLPFPLLFLVYLLLTANGAAERLKAIARTSVLCLGLALVISPWAVRNYMLTKDFVPTASVAGVAAQEGLYACQHLSSGQDFGAVQMDAGTERGELASQLGIPFVGRWYYQFFYNPRDELTFSRLLLKRTAAEYRKDPMLLARCGGQNVMFNFWFLGKTRQATWLNMAAQVPLLLLGLGGVVLVWRRGLLRKIGPMLTFMVFVPAVHAPIIAHARHCMVLVPFLSILASVSIVSVANTWRGQVPREPAAA